MDRSLCRCPAQTVTQSCCMILAARVRRCYSRTQLGCMAGLGALSRNISRISFTAGLSTSAGMVNRSRPTTTCTLRGSAGTFLLCERYEDQGLPPPDLFGVPEDDLLFALPTEAIREYLKRPFPGWREMREECRAAEGLGQSDSPDWKSYAETHYGLPITTAAGVRTIIRDLDLAGVELPSIRAVVDEVINWAK